MAADGGKGGGPVRPVGRGLDPMVVDDASPAILSGRDMPPAPVLRVRLPDGRVEEEELLGGFLRRDRAGAFGAPRIVTLQRAVAGRGPALHKLYRLRDGVAAYAGSLAAGGVRAFMAAPPGGEYRYRNAALRRMRGGELAAAVDPAVVYDFDLLGREG